MSSQNTPLTPLKPKKQRLVKLNTPLKARSSQSVSLIRSSRAGRCLAISPFLFSRSNQSIQRTIEDQEWIKPPQHLVARFDENLIHLGILYGPHKIRRLDSGTIPSMTMPLTVAAHCLWITLALNSTTFLTWTLKNQVYCHWMRNKKRSLKLYEKLFRNIGICCSKYYSLMYSYYSIVLSFKSWITNMVI